MSITEFEYKQGFPALRLTHPTGSASVELLLYGAHVYSWKVNEKELLFLRFVVRCNYRYDDLFLFVVIKLYFNREKLFVVAFLLYGLNLDLVHCHNTVLLE